MGESFVKVPAPSVHETPLKLQWFAGKFDHATLYVGQSR
jgi:hypothetical protein